MIQLHIAQVNIARLDEINAVADGSAHAQLLRQRREWFERFNGAYVALWWVPADHRPSVDEAKQRLACLAAMGPTPFAFTFRQTFRPDEADLRTPDENLSIRSQIDWMITSGSRVI